MMQMPITAGNIAKTASLMTRARRSPTVQSCGCQCHKNLAPKKKRSAKSQFPNST